MLTLICLFFFVTSNAFGDSQELAWPEFRGVHGAGHSAAGECPVEWSRDKNVTWQTEIPGKGWSSPVIGSGRIYLTTALPNAHGVSLRALALDEAQGKVVWDVEVLTGGEQDAAQIHSKNSLASPTPVLTESKIYVHFGHMGTAALDLTGKLLWKQTGLRYRPVHGNGGSPALAEDLLVFSCDGAEDPFLAALDARTGAVRWKTPRQTPARNKFSFSTPLIIEDQKQPVIVSATSGFVGGYSPRDGKEIWRVRYGEGYSVVPRPVLADGRLFVSSGFDRPVLYAIDPFGAAGDVTDDRVRWKQTKGAPNTPTPLVLGKEVYMISDGGIASCLNAKTGEIIWSERLGGNFSASPVAAGNRIYAVNESGTTYVLEAGATFRLLAKNEVNERTLATPAMAKGALFLRTESKLWRIGKPPVK